MALMHGLLVLLVVPLAQSSDLSSAAALRAKAWLNSHQGEPVAADLERLKRDDPDSYALVQNLLASPNVVFSVEGSEARAMDAPTRRSRPAAPAARWQQSKTFEG